MPTVNYPDFSLRAMRAVAILCLFASSIVSCNNTDEKPLSYGGSDQMHESRSSKVQMAPAPAHDEQSFSEAGNINRFIIRTADVRCQVEDYDKVSASLPQLLKEHQGYISHENEVKNMHTRENTFTLRVPEKRFDDLLKHLLAQARYIDYKNINSDDVTEEYIDTEARIRARKAAEERYLQLLAQAKRVEDMVAVENQLRQIREEIEIVQGRLKYLNDRVAMSTIRYTIYQPIAYQAELGTGFLSQLAASVVRGWHLLADLVLLIVRTWPLWFLALLILGVLKWLNRRKARP